jgi:hypothetical protein
MPFTYELSMQSRPFTADLLAPCGMNCGICKRYLAYSRGIPREKGKVIHCSGCRPSNKNCYIKRGCQHLRKQELTFCSDCAELPCANLDRLDRRYRKRYNMSMIETLKELQKKGAETFLAIQAEKYRCLECGDVISVHDGKCYACGHVAAR